MENDNHNKGVPFWKAKARKFGEMSFTSPDILWEACVEYFIYMDNRFWYKEEWKGKPLKKVQTKLTTPYTFSSLHLFLGIDQNTWYRYRQDENYKIHWEVVARVDAIIYAQKFEGSAVGSFNPMIIARDLGLSEKTENVNFNTSKMSLDLSKLTFEEEEALFNISLKMKPDGK